MGEELSDKVAEAKSKLEDSISRVIGVYLDEIRSIYIKSDEGFRGLMEERLELFIQSCSRGDFTATTFNYIEARTIRRNEGLSLDELSKLTGVSQSYISQVERGKGSINKGKITDASRKYLSWLEDHGYNQLNH